MLHLICEQDFLFFFELTKPLIKYFLSSLFSTAIFYEKTWLLQFFWHICFYVVILSSPETAYVISSRSEKLTSYSITL